MDAKLSDNHKPLTGKVAVVTGASRGAGRGIALVLGEAGATVYVTGRSVRGQGTTDNLPGTIEETAELVTARGGVGIPVRCDMTKDEEVAALFSRIQSDRQLDILVNNAWGGYEGYDGNTWADGTEFFAPFWEQSALGTDPNVLKLSGTVLTVGDLAVEYGFTDIDGRQIAAFRLEDM
ncbi:SDR family NAD(P)-dependent oxidoreductase [Phormidium pseudopriestleyi FRX01]|uniref:SDR family NAD(P)-dependent oxidoreductase n=1 Tax=Phormidium pseudopriestleyi FRX01 TaxID=1759528 RepID=A0ABS3FR85_9CYAN|nr:SDR family NAD(P)-dependent oxidoreductase [Phormidium pseudopriestleyi FRX01]